MSGDRGRFYAILREAWGPLRQGQVDGIEFLLWMIAHDHEWRDPRWIAYALATVKHETADTYQPVEEYGHGAGRPYGVPDPETGQTYYGRGYVQLTHRENYAAMAELLGVPLVTEPQRACQPAVAYAVLAHGMRSGLFTGKKLGDYINQTICDYAQARRVVNGTDQATRIAGYAQVFQRALDEVPVMNWLERKAADVVVGKGMQMIPNGYMTKIGAVSAILAGVSGGLHDLATQQFSMEKMLGYWTIISGGVAALGLRRAIANGK